MKTNQILQKRKWSICFILYCILLSMNVHSQNTQLSITGQVTDENGEPMIGVTVQTKNAKQGAVTNLDGHYSIKAGPDQLLIFSFIGYESTEIRINGRTRIPVKMQPAVTALEQVVVVGYGTQRKVDITGSISSLSAEEITSKPTANVLDALSGKIAGVQVVSESEPGAAPAVRIRGIGSYNASSPICVIDGVFCEVSELSSLNPNDVESMSVLKDASSTAIYGSRGANGVIIVTTKQGSGEENKTRVNAGAYFSLAQMERTLPLTNLSQWQQLENLNFLADNWSNPEASQKIPYPDWRSAGEGNDWQDLITRTALTQNYNVSIGGSTPKMNYYLAASWLNQEGVIDYSNYKRLTTKFNASYQAFKWLKLGVNTTITFDNQIAMDRDILSKAGRRLPDAPLYNDKPDAESDSENFNGGDNNPYALLHYTHDRYKKSWKYITNIYMEASILKNLMLRSSISTTNISQEEKVFLPAFMEKAPESNNSEYKISRLRHNSGNNNAWLQENTLTYNLNKDKHRFSLVGGFTLQYERTQYQNLFASELPWSAWQNRNLWYVGQGKNISGEDGGSEKTYASYLARMSYTFDGKYSMTLTGRVDGSSAYPTDKKYGFFPAAGLSWMLGEEHFMKKYTWLDKLKLRASYGVVGNDKGVSAAQTLYADAVNVIMGPNNDLYKADALRLMIDNTLTWEESKTLNLGFEVGICRNLLSLTFDYYNKITSKVMMPLNIPPSNIKVTSNIGEVRNRGIEWALNYSPKVNKVQATFSFTGTTVNNEVTKINKNVGPISALPNRTMVGYPIGGLWGHKTIGVFQNNEQLAQMPKVNGSRPGDLMYQDVNGDGLIDTEDYVYLGSYLPKVLLGLTSSLSYRNFALSFELSSALGHKSFNRRMQYRQSYQNGTVSMLNAWHGEGTTNTHPRIFSRADASARDSDYFIENCDYLSVANVQLSYNLPNKWLKKVKMKSMKIYVSGSNLYTWTEATGYKPDVAARGTNANSGGLDDYGLYPNNRSYTMGLSLGF